MAAFGERLPAQFPECQFASLSLCEYSQASPSLISASPNLSSTPNQNPAPDREVGFADKPWLSDEFLPDNPLADGWVIVPKEGPKSVTLAEIEQIFEQGSGRELWNSAMERELPALVGPPGAPKLSPVMEIPELQRAFVANHRRELQYARRKSALVAIPMLMVGLFAWMTGITGLLLVAAVFGIPSLLALVDQHRALKKLTADEASYLATMSTDTRFRYWTFQHNTAPRRGGLGWSRAMLMLGAWSLVAAVQLFTVFTHDRMTPRWDVAMAGLVKPLVASEPWRLLTGTMLHGGLLHFVFNMGAALVFCSIVERTAHRRLAVPIWLLGALAGSLVSTVATAQNSVGASGGILAWMAFALVLGWRRKALLPPDFLKDLIRNMVLIALIGLVAWGAIDNAAHLGGALMGAAIGLWVFREPTGDLPLADGKSLRMAGLAAEIAFVVLTVGTILLLLLG